jgi:hypothetical protein
MRRVLSVILIAALTTLLLGVDRTSSAGQDPATAMPAKPKKPKQTKEEKRRAEVTRVLSEDLTRGSFVHIERLDGNEVDGVVQEIAGDSITVARQERRGVVTETIAIADIGSIERTSKPLGWRVKALIIGGSVFAGMAATVATCRSGSLNRRQPIAEPVQKAPTVR